MHYMSNFSEAKAQACTVQDVEYIAKIIRVTFWSSTTAQFTFGKITASTTICNLINYDMIKGE